MWTLYRQWKGGTGVVGMILAYALIRLASEGSTRWKAGILLGVFLAVAYIAEELVWMARREGRPCSQCRQRIQMSTFRVLTSCPHCGQAPD